MIGKKVYDTPRMPEFKITDGQRGVVITCKTLEGENGKDNIQAGLAASLASSYVQSYLATESWLTVQREQLLSKALKAFSAVHPPDLVKDFMQSAVDKKYGTKLIVSKSGDIFSVVEPSK